MSIGSTGRRGLARARRRKETAEPGRERERERGEKRVSREPEKRLNRGQKVFDVVLLINLRSPGHECHSERTLAAGTLGHVEDGTLFCPRNREQNISRVRHADET